jgi:carbonic anhydrase
MSFIETILQRNEKFVQGGHSANLKIIPSTKTIIIGCLDPRVDPMDILGLEPGEAAIYRNIGGRINAALVETLILLSDRDKSRGPRDGSRLESGYPPSHGLRNRRLLQICA